MAPADLITIARLPLLPAGLVLLQVGSAGQRLVGTALLLVGLLLDTLDGVVARVSGRTSLFGSVLDIAADRTYELVLWVFFAHLGMLPVAIPLIVIARTTLTDALRSIGVSRGAAPFEQVQGDLERFLVASTWMRSGYSASKVVTFCGLALAQAFAGFPDGSVAATAVEPMKAPLRAMAWLTVVLCVVRGLPVIVGALSACQPEGSEG